MTKQIEPTPKNNPYRPMVDYANKLIKQGIEPPKDGDLFTFTLAHLILNTPITTPEEEAEFIDSLFGEEATKQYDLRNSLKRISNLKNALR